MKKKYLSMALLPLLFVGCSLKNDEDIETKVIEKDYLTISSYNKDVNYMRQNILLNFSNTDKCNTTTFSSYNSTNQIENINSTINDENKEVIEITTYDIKEGYEVTVGYCKEGNKLKLSFNGDLYNMPVTVTENVIKDGIVKTNEIDYSPKKYNHNSEVLIELNKPLKIGMFTLNYSKR